MKYLGGGDRVGMCVLRVEGLVVGSFVRIRRQTVGRWWWCCFVWVCGWRCASFACLPSDLLLVLSTSFLPCIVRGVYTSLAA